jgi:2-polyprenyl-3-methyl-5-hydroxy-6-metoxy-1,4-benzoquinol methylase
MTRHAHPSILGESDEEPSATATKSFYRQYRDRIQDKRLDSPHPLRRYVHRALQNATIERVREYVKPGVGTLDAGCGEGSLALAMAGEFADANITGIAIAAARKLG